MTGPQGVTLWRRRLGAALRELREAAGLSREQVGSALDCSSSKISRIENGDVGVRRGDLTVMLNVYGVTDADTRQALIELARDAKQRGDWWSAHRALLSPAHLRYLELEAAATAIHGLGLAVVPDLLQTRGYALADIESGRQDMAGDQIARRVEVRLARQALLDGDQLVDLRMILDEAILHRQVGGREVLAGQLRHLVGMSERPNVTIQVLPFEAAAQSGVRAGFTLLRFSDQVDSGTVYVDGLVDDTFVERPDEIRQAGRYFAGLQEQALDPAESVTRIETLRSRV
jgi:transcriptional regulator with XRE-family HTH domain